MRILFYGQATGGNASLWFEFLNKQSIQSDNTIHFLARTVCTLAANFKVYKPYGKWLFNSHVGKFRNILVAKLLNPLYIRILSSRYQYDLVVLQGNYTPRENLLVVKNFTGKKVLNLYGSDFYRKYLLGEFTEPDRELFVRVLDLVDAIHCNWKTTFDDVLNEFPEYGHKTYLSPWGVADDRWFAKIHDKRQFSFLSTRALHSYNNVDLVVEAFCCVFTEKSGASLHVIGGYGNDPKVIKRIQYIIKKYDAAKFVTLDLDSWYEGESLKQLYDKAMYNICFGSTDQLTLSIPYAYLRGSVNILSPLQNYKELQSIGFQSQILTQDISVGSLVETFKTVALKQPQCSKEDVMLAQKVFDMTATYNFYLSLVE